MTKLYKAVDKYDNEMSVWMVNTRGVAISTHFENDELEIMMNKEIESYAAYSEYKEFKLRAIDPVLIAEW